MSQDLPSITEADILQIANSQSFERGLNYYRGGAIFEPVRQGNELRAYCHGSGYEPYRVSATLVPHGILTAFCTCPYDWGGVCKHVVALLLTLIHEPEAFHTIPPLDQMLAERSQHELIALIKEMLKREPDLVRLLELPLQSESPFPIDVDAYRRQITYALRHNRPGAGALAVELAAIVGTADRFLETGEWASAGALYRLILDEIVPDYGGLYDEHGDVAVQLHKCAQGLDNCFFEGSPDAETRCGWLEALLEAKFMDIKMGGIELAYPAGELVVGHATADEWAWIEDRVRQAIGALQGPYTRWAQESLVYFLIERLELTGHEEDIDDLVFELGSPEQQAFQHVRLGRFDEAIEIARQHFRELPGLVTRFAEALVEAGAGPAAVAYVTGLLDSRDKTSYLSWLAAHAENRGDLTAALDWWRRHFKESPHVQTYRSLRDLADQLGMWAELRPELLRELEAGQRWLVLLDIALDENDVPRALALLPNVTGWYGGNYEVRVAQAAEADYPGAALDIYVRQVERLIKARGRGNYREAAGLLTRVRKLYQRQGVSDDWAEYIAELRQRHRRLPALKDELNKAGF